MAAGYYDHIIRNERDYLNIWTYIDQNPARWGGDEYFEVHRERERKREEENSWLPIVGGIALIIVLFIGSS